jgi:hypothetical protein
MVLKKDDFLKLSINFKDLIEKFLKKSLYKFLRLAEDINEINDLVENGLDEDEAMPLDIIDDEDSDDSDLYDVEHNSNEENEDYNTGAIYNSNKNEENDNKEDKKDESNSNKGNIL